MEDQDVGTRGERRKRRSRADDPDAKRQAGQYRAELHERFANPFYSLAFVLLAVAFIGRAQSTRQNRWQSTAAAGVLSIGARMGGLAANNLVVVNAKWVPVLYAIPLGLILIAIVMMQLGSLSYRRRAKPRTAGPLPIQGLVSQLPARQT